MIFLFAFRWESELGYTLGTRLGKWDRELLWGNFTSPFCCWRCQSYQWGLVSLVLRALTAEENSAQSRHGWSMGNVATWSKTHERLNHPMESCRVPGLSLCSAKASVVISVPFCTAGCQEFAVEMGHLWHPTPHGFRERNAHCLAPSSYFHHAQCCEHTNRIQIALHSPVAT